MTNVTVSDLIVFMHITESDEQADLVTKAEAAEIAGVTQRTIDRYADLNKLPRLVNPIGHVRFHRRDVIKLITYAPAASIGDAS